MLIYIFTISSKYYKAAIKILHLKVRGKTLHSKWYRFFIDAMAL